MLLLETFFIGALIESFEPAPKMMGCISDFDGILCRIRRNQGYHFQLNCHEEGRFAFYHLELRAVFLNEPVAVTIYVAVDKSEPTRIYLLGSVRGTDLRIIGHRRDSMSDEEAMYIFSLALSLSKFWSNLRARISAHHQVFSISRRISTVLSALPVIRPEPLCAPIEFSETH